MRILSNIFLTASFLLLLISVNVYVWIHLSNRYNQTIQLVQKNNSKYAIDVTDEHNLKYFINNYTINSEYSKIKINNPYTFLKNDSAKLQKLLDRTKNTTLIFRFSGFFCDACNMFVIKKLKQHFPDFATSNKIILIGSEIEPRLRVDFFGKEILTLKNSKLGLPIEETKTPFIFLLNKKGKIDMVFIPDKSLPEYTDRYLEFIKKNLLQASQ